MLIIACFRTKYKERERSLARAELCDEVKSAINQAIELMIHSVEGITAFEIVSVDGDTFTFEITYGESRAALSIYMV